MTVRRPGTFSNAISEIDPELDLIPYKHFLELYRHSDFLTVYIHSICVFASLTSHSPNAHLAADQ
jgi:hypothetical protein